MRARLRERAPPPPKRMEPEKTLPPGVVPSGPGEDAFALLDEEEECREGDIVREGTLAGQDSPGEEEGRVDSANASSPPDGVPHRAWASPEEPEKFQMNLSDEGEKGEASGTTVIPVKRASDQDHEREYSAADRRSWSPFAKSKATEEDLRKEVVRGRKKLLSQTAPKQPLSSPLKRLNRVAPSPVQPGPSDSGTLQSSSASMLSDAAAHRDSLEGHSEVRPGSAPMKKIQAVTATPMTTTVTTVTVQPTADAPHEPIYSKVNKGPVRRRLSSSLDDLATLSPIGSIELPVRLGNTADQALSTQATPEKRYIPELLAAMPKLDCYEPIDDVDSSIVIANPTTGRPTDHDATPPRASPPPDPLYEVVHSTELDEEQDLAELDPALYKNLKKHNDTGNVQLVSMRATSDLPGGSTMAFPQGASHSMHPIHYAAANGNKKELEEILSALPISQDPVEMVLGTDRMCRREGVDLPRDSEGRTALMHAVHNGHVDCVKVLVEAGADLDAITNDGSSCLHEAAYSGPLEIVALLLSLGASGTMRDKESRTPLHWGTNNSDPKCIDVLLDKVPGLDANTTDGAMMTPLMWAAFHGKPDVIRKLVERGSDPAQSDMDGMKAVHWSVQRHDTRALTVLINSDSSQYTDLKGKTVMHQAAEQGCAKAVSLIKAVRPTSVNDLDENARSPLHWATVCENPEVIRALLANGADQAILDNSARTALDYAIERGLHYCALLLSKAEDGLEDTDMGYTSYITYGTSSASVGGRAIQHQSGHQVDAEELKKALTHEQIVQIQMVCIGSWINKFTNDGRGPLHPRFFRINPADLNKIMWSKSKNDHGRDVRSDILVGVRSSASPAVFGRKDFDPLGRHKYAFTIFTTSRVLDVVALSSDDFKTWLNGLQLILNLGSITVARLLAAIKQPESSTVSSQ